MQELASHVYIETAYAGVTLGAINGSHGLILIDSPFRPDDIRSWRSALLNLGGGIDRLLVNLDAHFDRTLGVRNMDCTIVGQEKMVDFFKNRPVTFKTQGSETGAEWELYNGLGSVRWVMPEITFSEELSIHWDEVYLRLEHHPGPAVGAAWALLPDQHVAFLGDAVTPGQPPFLAYADLPIWIDTLHHLMDQPMYRDYLLVSGRGGLIAQLQVRQQLNYLEKAHQLIGGLAEQKAPVTETESLVAPLLVGFDIPEGRAAQYAQRLKHGLAHYYTRHYLSASEEIVE